MVQIVYQNRYAILIGSKLFASRPFPGDKSIHLLAAFQLRSRLRFHAHYFAFNSKAEAG
jgi:hypothetical protein